MAQRVRPLATYADLEALPENMVGEIVFGMLHASPRPRPIHSRVTSRLGMRLGPFDHDGSDGWVILDEPELHLGPHIVVPDLAGWRRERLPEIPIDQGHFQIAPDWICEVLSSSTERLDRGDKKRIYETFMVQHLWLADAGQKTIEVYTLHGSDYRLTHTLQGDQTHAIPPFEGMPLTLADLWAR